MATATGSVTASLTSTRDGTRMNLPGQSLRLDCGFEQQARRTPDRVAVFDGDSALTFAELKTRSDHLLAQLLARGISAGSHVGVHMSRSATYITCILAVLKANAAVVPLPPNYPESRLREILAFAKLDIVLDDAATPLDPSLSDRVMHVSGTDGRGHVASDPTAAAAGDPDQPAFVLCSSGSTGMPKLIVRSHRSFFHRLQWTWDNHPYTDDEVCCQKSHMTTTHAIYELFEPLLRGIPVRVISDPDVQHVESFWETIRAQSISRLLIVPSLLQAALDVPGFVAPPLKVLTLMGEYVSPRLAEQVLAAFPAHTRVYSIYGSTEASSILVCDIRSAFRTGAELPLGTPISSDVRALVLNAHGKSVAAGETGILHVAGSPLFSGYFRDPALTAAAFTVIPDIDTRVFNSRDQVRLLTDGSLQFVGRSDHTVKIRGFRVDLQEVENALLGLPEVRQGAVVVRNDASGSSMLLAFVVPATIATERIVAALHERLPAYMLPSIVTGLDALPLTASGKVDRQALLVGHANRARITCENRFSTDTARQVAKVWETVLRCGSVQPDSSFFDIGGSSLTVFAVVHRLRSLFALDRQQLSDISIYQFPTVAALAAYIDGVRAGSTPRSPATNAILVTLKRGDDANAPVFVISSAGGTLGAYSRLVKSLHTRRSVIGVRDPYIWGGRDATSGFQHWIDLYVNAIRERQSHGPYHVLAYSSASAFGYEIAQHLRRGGETVAILVLIDPLALDRGSKRRFGYWALQARFMRRPIARLILLAGWLRRALPRGLRDSGRSAGANEQLLSNAQYVQAATNSRTSKSHMLLVSALMELDSGLPVALADSDLAAVEPTRYLDVLLERWNTVAPEIESQMIEKIIVQYNMQVHAQHRYRLQRYDGKVVLFEPTGPYNGLLAAQFGPYVSDLEVHTIALGEPSARTRALAERFPARIRSHYLSMRDDVFASKLADELKVLLQ